jgi:tRNA(Ile)-lysidine synthase
MPTPTVDREHLRPGDRVCAAVSGGADSVAMLLLLQEANRLPRNALGVGLSAAHVHHGIRGAEADGDREFVRELCERLEVPLRIHEADVPRRLAARRAEGEPETLEEAARNTRYEFFRELIFSGHANVIATAHTLDDQAETVLMKLLRGAWTEGLGGIFPVVEIAGRQGEPRAAGAASLLSGRIIRPVLHTRRADLRAWLEVRSQGWREDSSNQDEAYTRNRLRHVVLPLLRRENPALDETLARISTLAREDEARWDADVARLLPQILLPGKPVRGGGRAVGTGRSPGGSVAIEVERLRALDPAMRRRILRAAARRLGCRLDFDDTERLLAVAGLSGAAPGYVKAGRGLSRVELAGGLRAERSPRELRLYLAEP